LFWPSQIVAEFELNLIEKHAKKHLQILVDIRGAKGQNLRSRGDFNQF
jgi:hypothetical protein